jgi:hypothetical protein
MPVALFAFWELTTAPGGLKIARPATDTHAESGNAALLRDSSVKAARRLRSYWVSEMVDRY